MSLVDKDRMRTKQAAIAEILKAWNKANVTVRTAAVTAVAESVATEALTRNEVCHCCSVGIVECVLCCVVL